jgi:hypothetical protein
VKEVLKNAKAKKQELKRKREEDQQKRLEDDESTQRIELYAKKRKFMEIKDCLCMSYVVRCILGPMSY